MNRRGSAMVFALIVAMSMAALCVVLLTMSLGTERKREQADYAQRSLYVAEAGLSDAYVQLAEALADPSKPVPTQIPPPGAYSTEVALGSSSYQVQITAAGPRDYSLVSTGADGSNRMRLELIAAPKATGFFQFAAFGAEGVVLDSNAFIDSYDSALGTYASQIKGGNTWARENGDVGSNADILLKANTEVHGDAQPGPGHIVDDSAPNTYVSGSMSPLEEELVLPPIVVPAIPSSGSVVASSDLVLGPGDVHYDSIRMMGGTTLTIVGPARIVSDDFEMKSNSRLVFDAAGGEIELYSTRDFLLESNSDVETLSHSALDVTIFLDGNNMTKAPPDQLELSSNSEFVGAIYAPNSKFTLGSNFSVFGSLMCGQLDLSSFGTIHFDEALLYDGYGATGELESKLWRRLPNP
jgi:hypothetical protein